MQEKEELLADLAGALKMVETLQNLLPLCPSCQKIHHDQQSRWMEIADYLRATEPRPPRPVCPDCLAALEHPLS